MRFKRKEGKEKKDDQEDFLFFSKALLQAERADY